MESIHVTSQNQNPSRASEQSGRLCWKKNTLIAREHRRSRCDFVVLDPFIVHDQCKCRPGPTGLQSLLVIYDVSSHMTFDRISKILWFYSSYITRNIGELELNDPLPPLRMREIFMFGTLFWPFSIVKSSFMEPKIVKFSRLRRIFTTMHLYQVYYNFKIWFFFASSYITFFIDFENFVLCLVIYDVICDEYSL